MESADGVLHLALIAHGDEAEATRPSGLAVFNDLGIHDVPDALEGFAKLAVIDSPRESADKKLELIPVSVSHLPREKQKVNDGEGKRQRARGQGRNETG